MDSRGFAHVFGSGLRQPGPRHPVGKGGSDSSGSAGTTGVGGLHGRRRQHGRCRDDRRRGHHWRGRQRHDRRRGHDGGVAGTTGVAGTGGSSAGTGGSAAAGRGGSPAGAGGGPAGVGSGGAAGAAGGAAGRGGAAGTATGGSPGTEPRLVTTGMGENTYWQTGTVMDMTSGTADVTITESSMQQVWDGFGGTFNEAGWDALSVLDATERDRAIQLLFGARRERGSRMGASRSVPAITAINRYTLNDTSGDYPMNSFSLTRDKMRLIPYIKAALALNPNIKMWGSPWTPPPWMKDNNAYDRGNMKNDAQTLGAFALYLVEVRRGVRQGRDPDLGSAPPERARLPARLSVVWMVGLADGELHQDPPGSDVHAAEHHRRRSGWGRYRMGASIRASPWRSWPTQARSRSSKASACSGTRAARSGRSFRCTGCRSCRPNISAATSQRAGQLQLDARAQ